jgi:hypothetical protein
MIDAYHQFVIRQLSLGCLSILTDSSSLVTHWIFAMKYWSISYRLELFTTGENADKHTTKFTVLNAVGIFFNILAGVNESFSGNP